MTKPKIAVILFPGTNCENETARAIESAGMEARIVRWNCKQDLSEYSGVVLPGGFSYEDRIRAGIVSAQDPIVKKIKKIAEDGKPVLGICNGAQILIESGMVPGQGKVEMALAPNINRVYQGFYCTWVNIKNTGKKGAFNNCLENEVIPIPIAHAEGRFVARDKKLIDELVKNKQIIFSYCNNEGDVNNESNPNSSMENIAGLSNKQGNVVAMMPHPERASWIRQLSGKENIEFSKMEQAAPARKVFESMKKYINK